MNKYTSLVVALGAMVCVAGMWIFTFQSDMGPGVQMFGFCITVNGLVVALNAMWMEVFKEFIATVHGELEQMRESNKGE